MKTENCSLLTQLDSHFVRTHDVSSFTPRVQFDTEFTQNFLALYDIVLKIYQHFPGGEKERGSLEFKQARLKNRSNFDTSMVVPAMIQLLEASSSQIVVPLFTGEVTPPRPGGIVPGWAFRLKTNAEEHGRLGEINFERGFGKKIKSNYTEEARLTSSLFAAGRLLVNFDQQTGDIHRAVDRKIEELAVMTVGAFGEAIGQQIGFYMYYLGMIKNLKVRSN